MFTKRGCVPYSLSRDIVGTDLQREEGCGLQKLPGLQSALLPCVGDTATTFQSKSGLLSQYTLSHIAKGDFVLLGAFECSGLLGLLKGEGYIGYSGVIL